MAAITITDLDNAKLDVDHIAEIANSVDITATDRQGHVKDTISGAVYKITAFTDRGAWAALTAYAVKDLVSNGGSWYVAVVAHTSSAAFATDTATKWRLYQGVTTGDLSASSGSNIVGFLQAGTGAVARTVQDKERDVLSVFDFMTTAQIADVKSGALTLDVTAAIQAALNHINSLHTGVQYTTKDELYFPSGMYRFSSTLLVYSRISISGTGTLVYYGSGVGINLSPGGVEQIYQNITGITIACENAAATVAIYERNNISVHIDKVRIIGDLYGSGGYGTAMWTLAGIQLDSANPLNTFSIRINECTMHRIQGAAILLTGVGSANISIAQNSIQGCETWGIKHTGGPSSTLSIENNEIEGFGTAADSGMISIEGCFGLRIVANHFEHSAGATNPQVKLGFNGGSITGFTISNNGFGGGVGNAQLSIGVVSSGEINNNVFASSVYAITNSVSIFRAKIENNQLNSGTLLLDPAGLGYMRSVHIEDAGEIYLNANEIYSGLKTKTNASSRGSMPAKPGASGNAIYYAANNLAAEFSTGDICFNSSPVPGGYIGWVCTHSGKAHYYDPGTLTSGSNIITGVGGAAWNWDVGDVICTDTGSIPVGTTIISKGAGTLTISVNAGATETVPLYGAKFNGFGLIQA